MSKQSVFAELEGLFQDSFDLDVGAESSALLTVIHESLTGLPRDQRLALVLPLLEKAGLKPTFVELYTPDEAKERGMRITPRETSAPATWDDALSLAASGVSIAATSPSRKLKRVVFYSYKGGVGRTTALVHTAFHLARRGKRVVAVDMDVEAPGLHQILPPPEGFSVKAGLVDYLWERQVTARNADSYETCVVDTSGAKMPIAYSVEDPVSRAQVYVVPAGVADGEYVRRLATLSYQDVLTRADDAWTIFEQELTAQIDPDILLIDARTGLGEWGGLSLLRLADEVFLVLFPSEQNIEGIGFVKTLIERVRGMPVHLVVSPVPEGPIGSEMLGRFLPKLAIGEESSVVEIYYTQGVAAASRLPVETAMGSYARLANAISESEKENLVSVSLQKIDRWKIIESLKFPDRDAKTISAVDFDTFFQKTSDFDKFLDDARWVVRGRKGTGKSTLFHLFVEHPDNATKRARGKLDGVDIVAGHGPTPAAQFRPTTDTFDSIQRAIQKQKHDWLSFWRAYALVRLWVSKYSPLVDLLAENSEFHELRTHLKASFQSSARGWRSSDTSASLRLMDDLLIGQCRDAFADLNARLAIDGKKLWLLYDDLDQDIKEDSEWQSEALGGLLRLAYDSNNSDLHSVRFKIFLREDIWAKLVFTNKSHFGEPRTVLLQWKSEDFLRLAYRLAAGGSPEFRALTQRQIALSDTDVDSASEEDLQIALAPLWGLNQEKGKKLLAAKWVYSRMTDSQDNTYPRSLTVLLKAAREEELVSRKKTPPPDRLLSPSSMQAGLRIASVERVNALKNEYPDLRAFLEDVEKRKSLRSQFTGAELEKVWERTSIKPFPTFESFVSQLLNSGLMARKRSQTYDFGFASLYIDGLNVTRVQGEKK